MKIFFKAIIAAIIFGDPAIAQSESGDWNYANSEATTQSDNGFELVVDCEDEEAVIQFHGLIDDPGFQPMINANTVVAGWVFFDSRGRTVDAERGGNWALAAEVKANAYFLLDANAIEIAISNMRKSSSAWVILSGKNADGLTAFDDIVEKSTVLEISLRGSSRALSEAGCS
jgi:hypothetical protein